MPCLYSIIFAALLLTAVFYMMTWVISLELVFNTYYRFSLPEKMFQVATKTTIFKTAGRAWCKLPFISWLIARACQYALSWWTLWSSSLITPALPSYQSFYPSLSYSEVQGSISRHFSLLASSVLRYWSWIDFTHHYLS